MEHLPLISIILVTCGRPISFLKRSLNSIISQTYENFQVTIVDSNTDSNTSCLISEYINSLDRIKMQLIRLPGASNNLARNTGFKASKGDYVAFLDDDDEWAPDKLEKQVKLFEENTSIVYSNYHIINDKGKKDLFFPDILKKDNLKVEILGENVIGCTSMPLISSKTFIEVGGFDESFKANQDWDLWIRILQKNNAVYSSTIAGVKHYTQDSISNNKYRRISGWIHLFMKHAGKYAKNREQLTKATGFFAGEMLNKKIYLVGMAALIFHFVSKGIHSRKKRTTQSLL